MTGRWRIERRPWQNSRTGYAWFVICPRVMTDDDMYEVWVCGCRHFRKWSLARNFVFKRMGCI